jgi:hypothetical protein
MKCASFSSVADAIVAASASVAAQAAAKSLAMISSLGAGPAGHDAAVKAAVPLDPLGRVVIIGNWMIDNVNQFVKADFRRKGRE